MKNSKKSLLWRIETKDFQRPSYLFGTMHVKDQRAFQYEKIVFQKIAACDAFAAEFNLEEANLQANANSMDLPNGMQLDELMRPKTYQKVRKMFRKMTGLELDFFKKSQPLVISNLLTESILSKDMPFSLDEHLYRHAKELDKIRLGVESFEEQLAILKKIPLEHQVKSLIWTTKNIKTFRKQLLQMTKVYQSGDIQRIFKSAKKSAKGLRKVLLYDRNLIMAERIAKLAKEQAVLFAIGAGHLGGKKGVLRLLKQKGFKVKPVKIDG